MILQPTVLGICLPVSYAESTGKTQSKRQQQIYRGTMYYNTSQTWIKLGMMAMFVNDATQNSWRMWKVQQTQWQIQMISILKNWYWVERKNKILTIYNLDLKPPVLSVSFTNDVLQQLTFRHASFWCQAEYWNLSRMVPRPQLLKLVNDVIFPYT